MNSTEARSVSRQRLKTIIVFTQVIKGLLRQLLMPGTIPADARIEDVVVSEGKLYVVLEHPSFPELSHSDMLKEMQTAPVVVDLHWALPETDSRTEQHDDPLQPPPGFFRSVKHFRVTTAEQEVIEFELLAEGRTLRKQLQACGLIAQQPSIWLVTNVTTKFRWIMDVPHTDECDRPLWVANWWYLQSCHHWDSLQRQAYLQEHWKDLRAEMLQQDDNLHRRRNILPRSLVQPVYGVFVHRAEGEVSDGTN